VLSVRIFKSKIIFYRRDYKKLDVWKKSNEMYLHLKKNITPKFPKKEKYEMVPQLNRAALCVPLHIVEGCGRYTDKDVAHFPGTSLGSINGNRLLLLCCG
jgi:four helix bundle protein